MRTTFPRKKVCIKLGAVHIAELLNALDAYTYQACERPDWQRSQAKAFCDALRDRLISELPGYHDGPWTITPRSVPTSVQRRQLRAAQQH